MRQVIMSKYPKWIIQDDGTLLSLRYSNRPLSPKVKSNGYLEVGGKHYVHRIIAEAFVDGYFEGATVDHIDGDKSNNHYTNLKWVTRAENVRKHYRSSRDLPLGVHKVKNRYKVSIYRDGKNRHIGSFVNLEDAVAARKKAENESNK